MTATSFSDIFSAITVFVFIGLIGAAGFVVSQKIPQWSEDAKEQLKGKNIDISNSGVRVGIKGVSNEEEQDKLQRAIVRTMSNSHANPVVAAPGAPHDKHRHHVKRWKNHEGKMVEERVPVDPREP
ncbi:uncharacterized protein LAJ45_04371 [Morchella importuna]|uniref:Uncharacterized protein n=1 Tax=Morchella conica CCBAS932 TaxID=1392247 RepID=A0A3N4KGK8_9PEZI|nr:uncharacterized protein H6S33_012902 [Morchella sextelata]XP_045973053.1 uncharacterized protein LAJ45_04371 [Morchella importuna]KAH0609416.1 hypothetical protein H6S33_012902 [Morchella sextelata]KAH8151749.1 hypothetical protein LAJ45_04371 [Morchella importuna]RPB08588.1 hypothetical protein P167DRAFT_539149 [Morchella conica CCBAS932]